jgi:hypothetical protein
MRIDFKRIMRGIAYSLTYILKDEEIKEPRMIEKSIKQDRSSWNQRRYQ